MSLIQGLIVANNRPEYLRQVIDSISTFLPIGIDWITQNDTNHEGMAANVQAGWQAALAQGDWDYLLHWEDDMVATRLIPIHEAVRSLQIHCWANIIFQRQPWNELEQKTGSVAAAIEASASYYEYHGESAGHDHIFSLNPCLIRRSVVEMGWPEGNEAQMTERLKAQGYRFGVWDPLGPPYIDHIGYERGPGWRL